jgi:chitosanase
MPLTDAQKRICEQIVNVFETGSTTGDYGNVTVMNDGPDDKPQVTYGRSQTTEYGNLKDLIEEYTRAGGACSAQLASYVAKIGVTPLHADAEFKRLLREAGNDPVMRQVQDPFFDKHYFQPAMNWAASNGFMLPLSILVIYDSFIHSGSIRKDLRSQFAEHPPSNGGDERRWIDSYVTVRRNWLANHARPVVRKTTYRMDCFRREIDRGNWDLAQIPIDANGVKVG